ncbi:MAG TPA: hypothetical protein VEG84_08430 [Thermoanaerobaculia bacterium]|nr:hypothetical protein [Thermoanaerobaculia bacterium]
MDRLFILFGIAFLLSLIPLTFLGLRAYRRYRGKRVVVCPETRAPVAVELDAARAAASDLLGDAKLRLQACTRWPERQDCGQECLAQVEASPDGCLVRTMLAEWYRGQTCALCGCDVSHIVWSEHKPALMSPGRQTLEWQDVPPEKLPEVFATHYRICWDCHIAESFRALHPELVVDDPLHMAPRRSAAR